MPAAPSSPLPPSAPSSRLPAVLAPTAASPRRTGPPALSASTWTRPREEHVPSPLTRTSHSTTFRHVTCASGLTCRVATVCTLHASLRQRVHMRGLLTPRSRAPYVLPSLPPIDLLLLAMTRAAPSSSLHPAPLSPTSLRCHHLLSPLPLPLCPRHLHRRSSAPSPTPPRVRLVHAPSHLATSPSATTAPSTPAVPLSTTPMAHPSISPPLDSWYAPTAATRYDRSTGSHTHPPASSAPSPSVPPSVPVYRSPSPPSSAPPAPVTTMTPSPPPSSLSLPLTTLTAPLPPLPPLPLALPLMTTVRSPPMRTPRFAAPHPRPSPSSG